MRHPQMPTEPDVADIDDLPVEIEERRAAPTISAPGQTSGRGSRFTRGGNAQRGAAEAGKAQQVRLLPGRKVPGTRYRLVRWLGEGGMGVVYEAEHEDIERRIALKILRHEASEDPQQAARFRDEARAASKIGSPNIVQILDFGELPDGRLMFFMELLAGQGLDNEIEGAPMDQARLIGVLRQVCKGLAAAHDVGIVHRDIKPDNIILVTEGGRADVAKIVDFGIATMLTAGNSDAPAAGTPQYMAPEQILGNTVDGRLDIYSVGCMAYELLTGHPPFHQGSVEAILEQQLTGQPIPLQQMVAPADLHPALAAVIMRCLAKHPEQRFRDMRDLEAALCEAQIAAGLQTPWDDLPLPDVEPERRAMLASKMPRPEDVGRKGKRWLWPLIAVVGIAVAAALAFVLMTNKPPEPGEEQVVEKLVADANAAGAGGHWVYPAEPGSEDTSFRHVLKLEGLPGSIASLGRDEGRRLRGQFFTSLKGIGDNYWARPDGKSAAADFYAQAIVFAYDPDLAVMIEDAAAATEARDRAGLTRTGIANLVKDAANSSFTETEIQAAEIINTLAEPDEDVREEKVKALSKKPGKKPLSATQLSRLTKLAAGDEESPETAPDGGSGGEAPPAADSDGESDVEVPDGGHSSTKSSGGDPDIRRPATQRDPKESRRLSTEAASALASGQRKKAEGLFHQALSFDNRNAAALIGLSDIHFDRSEYQQAVQYATKAVQAAPKKAGYRIRLGDAYFKLLRYTDALAEYEAAHKLGSKEANERIAKVKARLGK